VVKMIIGDTGMMGNLERQMTGQLLMLFTAAATCGFCAIAFANILGRRVRVPVRTMRCPDGDR
jgi:uncharacterized membrane protein YqgA involved in biofilm formation